MDRNAESDDLNDGFSNEPETVQRMVKPLRSIPERRGGPPAAKDQYDDDGFLVDSDEVRDEMS